MKLRDMSYLFVVYLTRMFIFSIFILSFILAYIMIFHIKKDTTIIYLQKNPTTYRAVSTRSNPGINTEFVANWIKNFIIGAYNFNMNDVDDGKFLDKLKPSLLYPSAFKSDFLGQKWVQKVKNNNLTVSSIIDGTMVSNGYGYVMTRDGEWNFWFPLWIEQEGQGVKSPPGETGVTVTVKQVAAEDAPLSGLKVVSVNQNDQDS
jgi:hypothetical protein